MPSVSKAQHNYFEMIAHDPGAAKRTGTSQAVAKEFVQADTGRDLKALPQRVPQKARGGAVYPRAFRW